MAKGSIIGFHGWGFNAGCWDEWKKNVGNDFNFFAFERGYFSDDETTPGFPTHSSVNIIFSHSYGLHLCPDQLLKQADLLFIFGGFRHFHPVAAQFRRRSKMMLNQMIDRLEENPRHVLKEFYANTYAPRNSVPLPEGELNQQLLQDDLVKLGEQKIDIEKLKSVRKIGILHGSKDGIVPRAKGRELCDMLSDRAKYFEVKQSGHALPFTDRGPCWSIIEAEIEQYIRDE